jgi:hypothetical protein
MCRRAEYRAVREPVSHRLGQGGFVPVRGGSPIP